VIYIDSCLVIYLVEGDPVFSARIKQAMESEPDALFAISPLVEMECLVGVFKAGDRARERAYRRSFTSFISLSVTREAFRHAAMIRAIHGLKTPDALHLAIAQQGKCSALWTNDTRFAQVAPGFTVSLTAMGPA